MSADEPGPSQVKNIKAKFESATSSSTLNHPVNVEKTKRLFEKTTTPINSSNRFKPALKPKPKYLQQKIDPQPPPVPKHASFNPVSPVFKNKFNFPDNSYPSTSTSSPSLSTPLSPSDNFRDSQMSDDFLPSTPTTTDTLADSSSSEESSPEFEEDDLYDREKKLSVHDESPAVDTLHTSVINEMKEKGLFKQLEAIKENKISNGRHEIENKVNNGIESHVAANEAPEPPPHQAIDKYSGVNEKVKESLITMERLVAEMGQTEEQFVNMLTLMIRTFPEYLSTCKLKGRKYTSKFKETVAQIVKELEPVLQVHESLLNDLVLICLSWDSRMPNLSHVLLKNIDFLQICVSFLMKKNRLCEDFKSNIDADTECKHATRQFEDQIMNNPEAHGPSRFESMVYKPLEKTGQTSGVSYHQQLDVIHQNVVRYKIFSDRYADLLDPLCEDETAATKLVIEKLDKIVNTINSKLEEPHAVAFLLEIYDKLQSHNFNILMPGRRLVKEGLVLRQARKGLIERQLILFSDNLLVCHMDYSELWKIDLLKLSIKVEDGFDRDSWFILYSTKKSSAIMCPSKTERDSWVNKILNSQNELRQMQRRNDPPELENNDMHSYSALWVPDDEASMCMLADCCKRFRVFQRRHHCRRCGYCICNNCSAFALLPNGSHKSSRVCPLCFKEILELLQSNKMEWSSIVEDVNEKRIKFTNGQEKAIKKLFIPPKIDRKIRGDDYTCKNKYLAAGTIYTKNGTRFGRLTNDFNFYIFIARYDPQPAEHFFVGGYSYVSTELAKDDRVKYKLTKESEPKSRVIEFEIEDKYSTLWEDALDQLK